MAMTHPFMWTASGKKWVVEDLSPEMIDTKSIAYGLAKECRFGGQIEGFYSVARHSLNIREAMQRVLIRPLWIYPLLHDAAEAYIRDMCKPVKVCLPDYNTLEDTVTEVIENHYNLARPSKKLKSQIKAYDSSIVVDEAVALFENTPVWVEDFAASGVFALSIPIKCSSWEEDAEEFSRVLEMDLAEYMTAKDCGWVA